MTAGELDALVSRYITPFLEGIDRAVQDVGKLRAANERAIMAVLDQAVVAINRKRRELQTKPEAIAEAKELDRKMDEFASAMKAAGQTPTAEAIMKKVEESPAASAMVAKLDGAIRDQRALAWGAAHAAGRAKAKDENAANRRQMVFEFYHHPKFLSIPRTLTYIDPDTKMRVEPSTADGLRKDFAQAILQCDRDRNALMEANDYLETLRKKHKCDLPAAELLAKEAQEKKNRA